MQTSFKLSTLLVLAVVGHLPGKTRLQAQGTATQAAESAPQDEAFADAVEKALMEYNLGHWSEARAYFLRAHQVRPSARTLRGLAITSYELREYSAALSYHTRALESPEHPLTEEMKAQSLAQIRDCRSFITTLVLSLEPKTASVRVDGEHAQLDGAGAVMLDPGEHRIDVEAQGYEPATQRLVTHGGERRRLRFQLTALGAAASARSVEALPATPLPQDVDSEPGLSPRQLIGIGLGSAGVAGLAVGTVLSVVAANENDDSKGRCPDNICDDSGWNQRQSALRHADMATVSFVAAGALLVAGAVTFLVPGSGDRASERTQLTPIIAPGKLAFALARRF